MRPIVHPTDFSPASRPAFAAAIEMAKATRSVLVLMHVLNPAMPPVMGDEYIAHVRAISRSLAEMGARAPRSLDGSRPGGTGPSGVDPSRGRRGGSDRSSRAIAAGMIVMGTHGRSGVKRVAFGSVAARVLSHAPCPVLTVRGR